MRLSGSSPEPASRCLAERPVARTTRTATTVWIGPTTVGPTTVGAASPWWAPRRPFAVVLSRHVPTRYLSLSGQREEPAEEASPEELLAGAHSASLAVAVSAGLRAARHPPVRVRVEAACELDEAAGG